MRWWGTILTWVCAAGCGLCVDQAPAPPEADGAGDPTSEALLALGYFAEGGPANEVSGVIRWDRAAAVPGTNLVVSLHAFEAVLMDMEGRALHMWHLDRSAVPAGSPSTGFRRAWLLPDGGLMVLIEAFALIRLDRDSAVTWRADGRYHHDVWFEPDGSFYVLKRQSTRVVALGEAPVVEDLIVGFSPDGVEGRSHSILRALGGSRFARLLASRELGERDVLHTNSLQRLDGSASSMNAEFAEGNFLVSTRSIDALLVVDPEKEKVVWAHQGPFDGQHDARAQADGTVLLFDNQLSGGPSAVRRYRLDDMSEVWSWAGGAEGSFRSTCCGTAAALPNGNVLVVVADEGLAVEVSPDGRRVWEWRSPYGAPSTPGRVARLMDVRRTPPAEELGWLAAPSR